jgi:hypothetical protein
LLSSSLIVIDDLAASLGGTAGAETPFGGKLSFLCDLRSCVKIKAMVQSPQSPVLREKSGVLRNEWPWRGLMKERLASSWKT